MAFTNPPIGQSFGYNDRNELTASTRSTTTWGYEYDNIGNRETYDVTGQPTTTYTANLLNQYAQTDCALANASGRGHTRGRLGYKGGSLANGPA